MSRNLAANLITEVTAENLSPIFFFQFNFDSGTIRYWTGYGNIIWDGFTWIGSGHLLQVSFIEETIKDKAAGVQFTLNGVPSSVISLALNEDYQGRLASVYFGCLDTSGAVVSDPYLLYQGYMDQMEIIENGDSCLIGLKTENRLITLERPNKQLYTSERQKFAYPNDKGFDQVNALQELEITWGKGL